MSRRRPEDNPDRSCTLTVEHNRMDRLVDEALDQAATFLREDRVDLFASHVGSAYPVEYSPYQQHLGVRRKVIRWSASVTVRLRPEIVRARSDEATPTPSRTRPLSLIRGEGTPDDDGA